MLKIPYEFWIGARYAGLARIRQRRGRRDRFISFVAASSMAGIALSVAALIVVLSVANGFQKCATACCRCCRTSNSTYPAPRPSACWTSGNSTPTPPEESRRQGRRALRGGAGHAGARAALRGVQVRGIDPATEGGVSDLPRQMVTGKLSDLKPGGFGVVLGNELADGMGVKVGDTLMMMAPQGSISPAGFAPRMRQFTVVGVFSSGHYEYDSSLAFVDDEDAARVFRDSGRRATARGRHAEGARGGRRAGPGAAALHDGQRLVAQQPHLVCRGQDRKAHDVPDPGADRGRGRVQPAVLAGDGRQDKQSDIAILRTLGAGPGEVARIFLVQGALIGVIGTLLGVAGGIAIAYNVDVIVPFIEHLLGVQFLPREVYFISALPSDPQVSDIVTIGLTSLVLSLLATLYPSWRASRLQPAQVLRHD